MRVSAIIVAGGRGERVGGTVPKQLRLVGGVTMLERSVAPFDADETIGELIVVLPPDVVASPPECLSRLQTDVQIVAGGERRQDSVAAGFDAVASDAEIVVIHDAARPFCPPSLVTKTVEAAAESGAAIAAVPVQDTVKEGDGAGEQPRVVRTLPRERIFLAQTPQAFKRHILADAVTLGRSGVLGTDEAALAEQAGHHVRLVEGDPGNMKVTTAADLTVAQRAMGNGDGQVPRVRIGLGYDLHRVVEGRPLVLGGVTIPGGPGLLGHSDADVVCHAVTDAVLGAANAGDIGTHFPDDDERWKGASSLDLLGRAMAMVHERGCAVENVDVVVITDWPKIRDHADAMRQALGAALGVTADCVTIKGKTSEGVGPVARGEAIIVHAVALVRWQSSTA